MALTTLPLRLLKTTRSTPRNSLFFRSIGLGLMLMYLPLLTGCGPGGNSGDGSVIAIPGNGNAYGQSKIRLSPTSLDFSATEGANNLTPQTVNISNVGSGTFNWTVTTTAAWLSLSPDSGTTPSSFTATVNAAGLTAGTYSTTITVTIVDANTPLSIPVTLTILPATPAATISLSPTSLAFSATAGGSDPAAQTVTISNSGTGTLEWSVTTTAAWLSLSPVSGTAPSSFTAAVNIAGLAAGTYSATITVTGVGATNTPQSIPVALTVSAPTLSSSTPTTTLTAVTLTWNPNTDPGVTGYFVHYGTQSPNLSGSCSYAQSTFYPLDSLSSSTSPNVTISGLTEGTIYYFAVSAYNGFESSCSNEVSKAT